MSQASVTAEGSDAEELTTIYRTSRGAFLSTALFSSLVNILMLTGPIFMMQVYDRVLTSASVPTLVALIVIVITLYAYYGFLEFVRARLLVRIGRRVEERLRGAAARQKPWLKLAGKLKHLHHETERINQVIEREFETIEPEEWA